MWQIDAVARDINIYQKPQIGITFIDIEKERLRDMRFSYTIFIHSRNMDHARYLCI